MNREEFKKEYMNAEYVKIKQEMNYRITLTMIFSSIFFLISLFTIATMGVITAMLYQQGVLRFDTANPHEGIRFIIMIVGISSLLVGTLVSFIVFNIPMGPVNQVVNGMNRLASGEYSTRIKMGGIKIADDVTNSFNKLAEELENTEMLRSDFINNFSHEFKTPIVSILGFAKLLKRGNLTEEQKFEYLDIIEEESERLSKMATNVLDMTKIDNQTILTDITRLNVAEQIRACVILLEKKWSAKNIDMQLEMDELFAKGNAELLKHVWINLIDNAVKFSDEDGEVLITLKACKGNNSEEDKLCFSIRNGGRIISKDGLKRVFNKFYQDDKSHSSKGNGIGLSIVKHVVMLHEGEISVESGSEGTVFTVYLPLEKIDISY